MTRLFLRPCRGPSMLQALPTAFNETFAMLAMVSVPLTLRVTFISQSWSVLLTFHVRTSRAARGTRPVKG